jgi:taurine dioxygenase
MMTIGIHPLTDAIAAEIRGLDLRNPISDDIRTIIRQAWHKHLVLVVRGQTISPAEQIRFAGIFGDIDVDNPNKVFSDKEHPEIFILTNEMQNGKPSETRDIGWQWHADLTYTMRPSAGAVLHAVAVPEHGGDTMFANMYLAFESLSIGYKKLLQGLEAIHDFHNGQWFAKRTADGAAPKVAPKNAPVIQPLVSIHPETGRASLLIGETAVKQFMDMTLEESAPILRYLTDHATQPQFIYRHSWRPGDLLIWDNRCTMHKVIADHAENADAGSAGKVRRMHRVTLRGQPSGRRLYPLSTAA